MNLLNPEDCLSCAVHKEEKLHGANLVEVNEEMNEFSDNPV